MCTLFTNCLWVDRQAQIANPNWSLLLQIQIWNLDPSTNCSQKRNLIWRVALPSLFKRHPLYLSDPVQKAAKWQSFHKGKTLIFPNCPPYGPYIDALQTAVNTCLFFIRRCHEILLPPRPFALFFIRVMWSSYFIPYFLQIQTSCFMNYSLLSLSLSLLLWFKRLLWKLKAIPISIPFKPGSIHICVFFPP